MAHTSNRIVVGVDGSPGSRQALRWALREAEATGSTVEAVLVWWDGWALSGPPSLIGAGKEGLAMLKAELHKTVHDVLVEDGRSGKVAVTERVIPGHPAEALVRESESARLLVVGSQGLSGLMRSIIGSVSRRCAQTATVPVVIVPPAVSSEAIQQSQAPPAPFPSSPARQS